MNKNGSESEETVGVMKFFFSENFLTIWVFSLLYYGLSTSSIFFCRLFFAWKHLETFFSSDESIWEIQKSTHLTKTFFSFSLNYLHSFKISFFQKMNEMIMMSSYILGMELFNSTKNSCNFEWSTSDFIFVKKQLSTWDGYNSNFSTFPWIVLSEFYGKIQLCIK